MKSLSSTNFTQVIKINVVIIIWLRGWSTFWCQPWRKAGVELLNFFDIL